MAAPATPGNCTTCFAPLPPGSDRCTRCGTLSGDHRRCPGCGAKAETIAADGLVYTCAACGRPRVPMEQPGIPRSGREREALERVAAARRTAVLATGLGIAGIVADAALTLGAALFAAIVGLGVFTVSLFVFSAAIFAVSLFALLSVAKRARGRANDAMREAFGTVALDVMRARGPITARALGEILGVPERVAETALDRLPARDDVRVETVVDDKSADGLVRYRVAEDATAPTEAALQTADAEAASWDARFQVSKRAQTKGNG